MASPGSNPGSHGLRSPPSAISTPYWETGVDSSRTWTPGTTPVGSSQPPTGDGRTQLQASYSQSDLWRAHIEKQRLAEITRRGLDQTPSRFTPENETTTHPLMARSESSGSNIGQQAGFGTEPRQQLWSSAAVRWPTAFENGHARVPAKQSPLTQTAHSNTVNSSVQASGSASFGGFPVPTLAEPSRAATWTSQPLIPLSSFSDPHPPQFPGRKPPTSLSSWAVPANNLNNTNKTGISMPLGPMLHLNNQFDAFNSPGFLEFQEPTNLDIALHQNVNRTSETSRGMYAQIATHQPHWQHDRAENSPRPSMAPAASVRGPAQNPWRPNPLEAAILSSPLRLPIGLRPPALATQSQAPALGLSTVPSIPPFGLASSSSSEHGPHPQTATAALLPVPVPVPVPAPLPRPFPSPPSFYHPMNCRAAAHPQSQHEAHALLLKGFSPNYRGDPDVARNQSAAIPVEANCSLFLVGLAPDLTTHELLSGIKGVGRVYATHINPPAPERGHVFSAAKVVFFERGGAELFYGLYAATGYATPRNPHLRARVSWNRVRSAEVDKGGRRSRVLLISGPPRIVNQGFLGSYLDTKMVYQVDEVVHRGVSEDRSRVLLEFRFGSFRCQAEAARMALMREFREEGVVCEYGQDPCDRAPALG